MQRARARRLPSPHASAGAMTVAGRSSGPPTASPRRRPDTPTNSQPSAAVLERIRRRCRVEGHVGEHRHLREQHAESDGVGRQQLAVPQQPRQRRRRARPRPDAGAAVALRAAAIRQSAAAAARFSTPSTTNAACQLASRRDEPRRRARPQKPPTTVPLTYAAVARPACDAGHSLVNVGDGDREDARRQQRPARSARRSTGRASRRSRPAPVATASSNADPTMTRLRPTTSASRPTNGAAVATAMVGAVTVRLTPNVRRAEDAHQQRQQRLRRVEVEERGESRENDRPDRRREH